jgi:orotate phosphoribosyltransferase
MSGELERLAGARRGHFAFPSGFHGDLWLELDRLFAAPRAVAPFAAALAARLPPADVVCGPMTGGALLAQLVAVDLDAELAWSELPAYAIPAALRERVRGRRVAVVDDAINAGSAVGATIAALRACDAEVVAVGALMRLGGGYSPGVAFHYLEEVESGLWPADRCPLCAAGRPVEEPAVSGR